MYMTKSKLLHQQFYDQQKKLIFHLKSKIFENKNNLFIEPSFSLSANLFK